LSGLESAFSRIDSLEQSAIDIQTALHEVRADLNQQQGAQAEDISRLDEAVGLYDAQINDLQQTVSGEVERLDSVSNATSEALSGLESAFSRIDSLEQSAIDIQTALHEVRADHNTQIEQLTNRILIAEMHAAHYRRWHEETNARIDGVQSDAAQKIEDITKNLLIVQDTVHSQHHIFVTWKAALKARILKVLRIRQ